MNKKIYGLIFVFVIGLFAVSFLSINKVNAEVSSQDRNEMRTQRDPDRVKMDNATVEVRLQQKEKIQEVVKQLKQEREESRQESQNKKEELRLRILEAKDELRNQLKNIKDGDKKVIIERIMDNIQSLNIKTTNILSENINQIENVLISIELRIEKAGSRGLDISNAKTQLEKAKGAIEYARNEINIQSNKVYVIDITDENNLKEEVRLVRNQFRDDIENVRGIIQKAREAVHLVATTLAQIPNIDYDPNIDNVEDNILN